MSLVLFGKLARLGTVHSEVRQYLLRCVYFPKLQGQSNSNKGDILRCVFFQSFRASDELELTARRADSLSKMSILRDSTASGKPSLRKVICQLANLLPTQKSNKGGQTSVPNAWIGDISLVVRYASFAMSNSQSIEKIEYELEATRRQPRLDTPCENNDRKPVPTP